MVHFRFPDAGNLLHGNDFQQTIIRTPLILLLHDESLDLNSHGELTFD